MKIKHSANGSAGWLTGLGILLVGLLLGSILDPIDLFLGPKPGASLLPAQPPQPIGAPRELAAFLRPAPVAPLPEEPEEPEENGLETLHVVFDEAAARTLQKVTEDALNRGMIIQDEEDTVSGSVSMEGKSVKAELRIKGDWTDHVETDKWSLRIKLKNDKLGGMSVFSVQHPETRGMLWEWFIQAAARREGILAPRSTFVNVTLNGNPMGIYYLEEHFSKEMLESQQRREGPIVLWDESTRWASLLQAHNVTAKGVTLKVPQGSGRIRRASPASVRGFGEKRLSSIESLSRSMYSAVEQMLAIQSLSTAHSILEEPLRRIRALEDLRGRTLDNLVDTDKLAHLHALFSLFQVWHALAWHNMRFYHDPLLDRLEPILFDCDVNHPSGRDIPMFRAYDSIYREFESSPTYYNGVFSHLGRFASADYLLELMQEIGPQLSAYEALLDAEFQLDSEYTVEGMLQRLRTQQTFLRTVIYPVDAMNVHASHDIPASGTGSLETGNLTVDCWGTTRTPVEVRGFEFSNGAVTPAYGAIVGDLEGLSETPEGGVVLPNDGSPVRFRFSSDARLSGLGSVKQMLKEERDKTPAKGGLELDVKVIFRPVAAEGFDREALVFRYVDPAWALEGGRPEPPSLQAALEQHEFLELRQDSRELWVKPGDWNVEGDLVVPSGFTLHAYDAKLFFDSHSALISSSPLSFQLVALWPQEGHDRWRGVLVLQAKGRSNWKEVSVRATDAMARGGWIATGGVTFYRSSVTMEDCEIDGTWAEDGTNIFAADFLLERVRFNACLSDSFDGDFVTGTLKDCSFKDGLADGVDFSGSQVLVENCEFLDMGDKGISAGENSQIRVLGGRCKNVSIGIASKDGSLVTAKGMSIDGARNYALSVFIKKPEFGAASLIATGVKLRNSGLGDTLVQTDCRLEVDGQTLPTQDLDVKQLYRDKILGQ